MKKYKGIRVVSKADGRSDIKVRPAVSNHRKKSLTKENPKSTQEESCKVDHDDVGFNEKIEFARKHSINIKESEIQRKINKETEKMILKDGEKQETGLYPIKKTRYISLFKKTRVQSPLTYFAVYQPEEKDDWDFVFKELAEIAEDEDWTSVEKGKYGILKSYINQIFVRCFDQKKVAFSQDGTRCCFNTGLLTDEKKDVFMIFRKKEEDVNNGSKKWQYDCVVDSYSRKLGVFGGTPEIATFITNPEDLVFDFSYKFEVNVKHIIKDNAERIKKFFNVNDGLIRYAIEGALSKARSELMRNYRLAVPHWYKGNIQLLLPFDINGDGNPALTFILEKDHHMKMYRVKTVIPTEYAYINARVLRKQDQDWIIEARGE